MLKKFTQSFICAFRGLKYTWQEERNFRIQIIAALFLVIIIFLFDFSYFEASLLIFAATLVLASEVLNTVLEKTLDKIESNQSQEIGKIKDIMAGIVLLSSIGATIIGVLVFLHHFLYFL